MMKATWFLPIAVGFLSVACSTPKYAYHSVYALSSCSQSVTREKVTVGLVKRGYLHFAEPKPPYDIFRRPEIIKKGALAAEPYEDLSGEIAVAVCAPGGATPQALIAVEEWRGCKNRKDCTAENQRDLKKLAEDWGCQVSERAGRSQRWALEDRQDWTKDSCSSTIQSLQL